MLNPKKSSPNPRPALVGLIAMAGLGVLRSEGNEREPPPFYAFCVEAGVPGIAPRPLAEGVELLRSTGFDGGIAGSRSPSLIRAFACSTI